MNKIPPDEITAHRWLNGRDPELQTAGMRYLMLQSGQDPDAKYEIPDGIRHAKRNPLVINSYLSRGMGYGRIAEWLGRGLDLLGDDVGFLDIEIDSNRYAPPDEWVQKRLQRVPSHVNSWIIQTAVPKHAPTHRQTVAFTMWETSRISEEAVACLNSCRAVCTPSQWNAAGFRASGVRVPIHVVPLGVAASEGFTSRPWHDRPMTFGMAGRMAHGGTRKGLNEGMTAFVKAFPNDSDVRLSVKVFEDCKTVLDVPHDARITVDTRPLYKQEMADWYETIDVLLVPSKGEGWGMHTHEAMACGRPVIAAKVGGTAEFWDETCGWLLEGAWTLACDVNVEYGGIGNWFVPSEESIIRAMRAARGSWFDVYRFGAAAAERAAKFTWERTALKLRNVLERVGAVRPRGDNPHRQQLHAIRSCPHRTPLTVECSCQDEKARCAMGRETYRGEPGVAYLSTCLECPITRDSGKQGSQER